MNEERTIPASELIINDDGSVFHLHLRPDQLRDKIILVGDPGRVDMVASYFDSIDYDVQSREFHAIGGKYRGEEVMCLSHGIGADNIEIVVTELDALANIDFATRKRKKEHRMLSMVRIGTSGSLRRDIHIGDYVVARYGIGTDGIVNYYYDRNKVCNLEIQDALMKHCEWPLLWAAPYVALADEELMDKIGRDDMLRGFTIAAVGFYAPQGREVWLKPLRPDFLEKIESFEYQGHHITNFEMESGCLQAMAKMLHHKAMTVCCIIAERVASEAQPDYKPYVKRLVETVLDRFCG